MRGQLVPVHLLLSAGPESQVEQMTVISSVPGDTHQEAELCHESVMRASSEHSSSVD